MSRIGNSLRTHVVDTGLSALGGTLLALPAVSDKFFATPYLGLLPWVYLFGIRERRASLFAFFVGFSVYWITYHQFLARYTWWVPLLAATLYLPFYLPFVMFLRGARRLAVPWVIAVPVSWVAVEYIVATVSLARVALIDLGYSQAPVLSLVQVADLGGVYAVSFIVALVNGAVADVIAAGSYKPRALWQARRARAGLAAALLVMVSANLYGLIRLRTLKTEPGPRVGIVQPSVTHSGSNIFMAYAPAAFMTAQTWPRTGDVDLIVWPENAIQDYTDRFGVYEQDIAWLAARSGAPVLTGTYGRHGRNPSVTTNRVQLMDVHGHTVDYYDKIRMLPWVEYLPYQSFFALFGPSAPKRHKYFAAKIVGYEAAGLAGFGGERVTVFRTEKLPPFSAFICFESSDPTLTRTAARDGARFLVNPTSEGLIGSVMQMQMLRISVFRSVETRLPLVRAGNQGISAFVSPHGRFEKVLEGMWRGRVTDEPAIDSHTLQLSVGRSLYVRLGDWLAIASTLLAFMGTAWAFARRS